MENVRFEKGMMKLEELGSGAGKNAFEQLNEISPFLARFLVESFGEVCALPEINNREREIAVIAACTTLGYAIPQLKTHINAGLNVGLTKDEIIAIINTMSAYAGFPATLNSLKAAQEVFQMRGIM